MEMTSTNDQDQYRKLVVRIVKAFSMLTNLRWKVVTAEYNPLKFAVVNKYHEMLLVPIKNNKIFDTGDGFYRSYYEFIDRLIADNHPLNTCISSTSNELDFIFKEKFGETIEEINIYLDMLNV